jgi:glutamate decarboxylase
MYGAMTKRRFPSQQCNPQEIIAEVRDEFMLDANSRQNISTLCQRWLEDEVHRLMSLCVDKNIEDKDKYPGRTLRIHGGR